MRLFALCLLALLTLAATAAAKPNSGHEKKQPTELYIASGTLITGSGAPIQVHSLRGSIADGANKPEKDRGQKSDSEKVVTIGSGTARLDTNALSTLLNSKLGQRGLKNIKVSNDKGQVKITGTADKTVSVPFTIEGPVRLTPQGFIRLSTKNLKVAKLPGLADLLGINSEKMVGDGAVKGVQAQKDAIIFDPDLLWGLPVHGRVTRLMFGKNGLLLVFGERKRLP